MPKTLQLFAVLPIFAFQNFAIVKLELVNLKLPSIVMTTTFAQLIDASKVLENALILQHLVVMMAIIAQLILAILNLVANMLILPILLATTEMFAQMIIVFQIEDVFTAISFIQITISVLLFNVKKQLDLSLQMSLALNQDSIAFVFLLVVVVVRSRLKHSKLIRLRVFKLRSVLEFLQLF